MEGIETTGDLLDGLLTNNINAVSNGSFKHSRGTSAWTSVHKVTDQSLRGSDVIPGQMRGQSACQSELGRLYSIIFFIIKFLTKTLGEAAKTTSFTIGVGCDGKSALGQVFLDDRHIQSRDPDFDIIQSRNPDFDIITACRRRLAEFPNIMWDHGHIDGHQDKNTPYQELDPWAQLNCDMDSYAKERWRKEFEGRNNPAKCPIHPIQLAP